MTYGDLIWIKLQYHERKLNFLKEGIHYAVDLINENHYRCHMITIKHASTGPESLPPKAVSRDVSSPKRATSRELLGDGDQLVIEHEGREYRLRRTQNGKLILTA